VPRQAISQQLTTVWNIEVQTYLESLAETGKLETSTVQASLLIGDARQHIQRLTKDGFKADVIFFDPFSPPHCPELWTVEFIQQVAQCLHPYGRLATYSCAAAVRSAFQMAGLHIGPIPAGGRHWPGTLARLQPDGLAPLSDQEQDHLSTKAAVPYRDPGLCDSAEVIHNRRQLEQTKSTLKPTSQWRKRWLPLYQNLSSH
jgi:tRNA U34 5-methylaminomethyl-2-thiouridine-forming methyltransferase MnmC